MLVDLCKGICVRNMARTNAEVDSWSMHVAVQVQKEAEAIPKVGELCKCNVSLK